MLHIALWGWAGLGWVVKGNSFATLVTAFT